MSGIPRSVLAPSLGSPCAAAFGAAAARCLRQGPRRDAQARYQQERAACLAGQTGQDRATCLKEAGAALAEARRGKLSEDQSRASCAATDGPLQCADRRRAERLHRPDARRGHGRGQRLRRRHPAREGDDRARHAGHAAAADRSRRRCGAADTPGRTRRAAGSGIERRRAPAADPAPDRFRPCPAGSPIASLRPTDANARSPAPHPRRPRVRRARDRRRPGRLDRSRRCSPSAAATWSLLEKARHPRFHIGESLLPANVRAVRAARRARRGRADRHAEVGRRVRLARARRTAASSSSPRPGTSRCRTPGRCAAPSSTRSCSATPARKGARTFEGCRVRERRVRRRRRRRRRSSWTTAPRAALARALRRRRLGPRHAARQQVQAASARTRGTTARRCTATSAAPSACRASSKATSRSSGSSTAGSGSSRWPTAPPASARSAGRTT